MSSLIFFSVFVCVRYSWYNSSTGGCTPKKLLSTTDQSNPSCDGQSSGAYIFRPNSSTVFFPGPTQVPVISVVQGPVVTEVHQTFSDWATHVVRLTKGSPYVEVEWTAGPIPIDTPWLPADMSPDNKTRYDRWGKEVVVRYSSGLKSQGIYYTDSNGREMIQRTYNERGPSYPPLDVNEPVAGNCE